MDGRNLAAGKSWSGKGGPDMTVAMRLRALMFASIGLALIAIPAAAQPTARWVGQDSHDFVGTYTQAAKSDIQDIHFILSGLPAR